MIIPDSDIGGALLGPSEDDAPLVIDTDGVVASELSLEGLKSIAWRHGEVMENARAVHLDQLAKGDTCEGSESAILLCMEEFVGILVGKRLDHFGAVF